MLAKIDMSNLGRRTYAPLDSYGQLSNMLGSLFEKLESPMLYLK